MTVLEGDSGAETADTAEEATGLSAFGDDADGTDTVDSGSVTDEDPGVEQDADGEMEFTGVVVQAGNPVVLDDGEETMSVETDADVGLGEEVTVRGVVREGRLEASDVF